MSYTPFAGRCSRLVTHTSALQDPNFSPLFLMQQCSLLIDFEIILVPLLCIISFHIMSFWYLFASIYKFSNFYLCTSFLSTSSLTFSFSISISPILNLLDACKFFIILCIFLILTDPFSQIDENSSISHGPQCHRGFANHLYPNSLPQKLSKLQAYQ